MKCVILAGGIGTRISEESVLKPKPMIEIACTVVGYALMLFSRYRGRIAFWV